MPGPPPVIARARTAVRAALTARLELLADGAPGGEQLLPRVIVGVSGGADSLALLATTAWVGSRMGLETEAVIVDHGLAADSAAVAERATLACERLGAARATVRRVQVDPAPGGIENAARDARHTVLEDVRADRGGLAILLGHTRDDQSEQVLMALARGAGPRALAGIPPVRGPILRPFLGTGRDERTALVRADTEEICRLHDVDWWEDPMNADRSLLRARVRHDLLPLLRAQLGEQIDANLARTAELVRPDAELLDAQARETAEALGRDADPPDLLVLDATALARRPEAVRTRVLRDACRIAAERASTGSDKSLLRRQVLEADALLVSWHGQGAVPLPGRIEVARREGLLIWRPTASTAGR